MGLITLANESIGVALSPARGASILHMSYRAPGAPEPMPILSRAVPGEDPLAKPACFIMAPWTNRVAAAGFTFGARRYPLRPSSADGSAIHGDVRARAFTIIDRTPVTARLGFDSRAAPEVNFPWPFALEARYEIDGARLEVDLTLRSRATESFPAGLGLHPYLPRFWGPRRERATLTAEVAARYPLAGNIPIGPAVDDDLCARLRRGLMPQAHLDDVFSGWSGRAAISAAGVTCTLARQALASHRKPRPESEDPDALVIYAPRTKAGEDEPFIAVEPVTMINDGVNQLAAGNPWTGVVILAPGEELRRIYTFTVTGSPVRGE
ncbi:aldose 1-epimerase [soil metagenome]